MSETKPTAKKPEAEDKKALADKELEGVAGGAGGYWQQTQFPDDPPGTTRTVWRPTRG